MVLHFLFPNLKVQMIDSAGGGEGKLQMQVVTSFESLTCEIVFVVDGITIGSLPKQPQFDQNFLGTGLGFASKRIFLRKTNEVLNA